MIILYKFLKTEQTYFYWLLLKRQLVSLIMISTVEFEIKLLIGITLRMLYSPSLIIIVLLTCVKYVC